MDASNLPPGLETYLDDDATPAVLDAVLLRTCWLEGQRTRAALARGEILLPNEKPAIAMEQVEMMPEHFEALLGESYKPTTQDLRDAGLL